MKNERKNTQYTIHNTQLSTLFPLLALSITIILCFAIVASYIRTANMQGTVILPGGVTYTGR